MYISADEAIALLTALHADKRTIDKVRTQQARDRAYVQHFPSSWVRLDIPEETLYEVRCYGGSR